MITKYLSSYGGNFDRIIFDGDESIWVPEAKLHDIKAENEKLWELADAVKEFIEDTHCEDCLYKRDCNDNNRIFCANDFSYHAFSTMRKLGIEV